MAPSGPACTLAYLSFRPITLRSAGVSLLHRPTPGSNACRHELSRKMTRIKPSSGRSCRDIDSAAAVLGTHCYKWIQNRAKERIHASQVFPAACRILIATFKAHLVCRLSESLNTMCFCSSFPDVQGCTTWKIQSVSSIKYSLIGLLCARLQLVRGMQPLSVRFIGFTWWAVRNQQSIQ